MDIVIPGLVIALHVATFGGVMWLANSRRRDAAWAVFLHRWLLASYVYLLTILVSGFGIWSAPPEALFWELLAFLPFAGGVGLIGHAQMGGGVGLTALAFAIAAGGATLYLLRQHWRTLRTFVAVHLVALAAGLVASEIAFDLAIRRALQEQSDEKTGAAVAWSRHSVLSVFTGRGGYPQAHASAKIGECYLIWSFRESRFVPLHPGRAGCELILVAGAETTGDGKGGEI